MSMNAEITSGGTVRIHGVKFISAEAREFGGAEWLTIKTFGVEHEITLFMPYSTALEYASAINACNDREAVSDDFSSRT